MGKGIFSEIFPGRCRSKGHLWTESSLFSKNTKLEIMLGNCFYSISYGA